MEAHITEPVLTVLQDLTKRNPSLLQQQTHILDAFLLLCSSFSCGGKLLVCGNGGSAADALHIVGELMKSFQIPRPANPETVQELERRFGSEGSAIAAQLERALPAIALVENAALSSAILNDVAGECVFAQQVYGLGREGDTLLCISTSGNAKNVVAAAAVASARGMYVIGLTGASGGILKQRCDCCICVPQTQTFLVQELHLPVYHTLCSMLELYFFGSRGSNA